MYIDCLKFSIAYSLTMRSHTNLVEVTVDIGKRFLQQWQV